METTKYEGRTTKDGARVKTEGELRAYFDTPTDPMRVDILRNMPLTARVTSVVVRYTTVSNEQALAEIEEEIAARKRRDAAVKANATRKARKEGVGRASGKGASE